MLEMLGRPSLYAKIFSNLNNSYLPTEEKFRLVLAQDPYNVVPSSTDRAAKVFYSNLGYLNLLVNGSLWYSVTAPPLGAVQNPGENPLPKGQDNSASDAELFILPIPLPGQGKRKAFLHYPINSLTLRDIKVIKKALEFIESSIGEDDETQKEWWLVTPFKDMLSHVAPEF